MTVFRRFARSPVARLALGLGAAALLAFAVAAPAAADEHDPKETGHPLRIVAFVLHPIGVALDYLILRPAHWLVEREPFRTVFGNED